MKSFALAAIIAAASLTLAPASVQAQPQASLDIPISGSGAAGSLTGTFTLTRFVQTADGIAAVGRLTGTVTDLAGVTTSIVRTVVLPVAIGETTCDILHLELGPLELDLLGLVST